MLKVDQGDATAGRRRWVNRPPGANWGAFGPEDQQGRLNLITTERRTSAAAEVRKGIAFCLSLPLDRPAGKAVNGSYHPFSFHPVMRDGHVYFNMEMERVEPSLTDVGCDEAVFLYTQYSTHWASLAYRGALFDADGDGRPERVFYNGYRVVDPATGHGTQGALGAVAVSVAKMAETGVQGRGVLVDLYRHFGRTYTEVGYEQLRRVMKADGVTVEEGDILCLRTGFGRLAMDADGASNAALRKTCAVLDGRDSELLRWITWSGIAAITTDHMFVERGCYPVTAGGLRSPGPSLPLHQHCLFKLGVPLGKLWYFSELADWLEENGRTRFLLTAPPLRLPGAAGGPVTPIATV